MAMTEIVACVFFASGGMYTPAEFDGKSKFSTETEHLFQALRECRVVCVIEDKINGKLHLMGLAKRHRTIDI